MGSILKKFNELNINKNTIKIWAKTLVVEISQMMTYDIAQA